LAALGIVRTLGRGDEQTEHEGSDRSDKASAEPDNVLCVVGQMMVRKRTAKERSDEYAAEYQSERDQR
jgi:hypothetical protein